MALEGIAELPLHEGRVPRYLFEKMLRLGSIIAKYIIETRGAEELLYRLSDPVWFQAFSNIIGMDWNSSGSTTVVLYVLKRVFPPSVLGDMGIAVLGGKGRDALNTLNELSTLRGDVDLVGLERASRLSAKIDTCALQDGHKLYIHSLLVSTGNKMLVIQQGMNIDRRAARRYHIFADRPRDITTEADPHSAIASQLIGPALNLLDQSSREARKSIVDIVNSTPSGALENDLARVQRALLGSSGLKSSPDDLRLIDKVRQEKFACPIFYRPLTDFREVARAARYLKTIAAENFDDLLLLRGIGPETFRALALVSYLIYDYRPSYRDPTTHIIDPFLFSYAHGGKDGVPYRIRVKQVMRTVAFFEDVLNGLKAGERDREIMVKNLSRAVERLRMIGLLPSWRESPLSRR